MTSQIGKIYLSSLIKSFSHMIKKSGQNFEYVKKREYLYFPAPALCLALAPSPCPQFVFTGSYFQFVFTGSGPQLCLPALAANLCLPALVPNSYLPALAYNFITSPGPEFAHTNLVSSICICIYGPGLRFVLPVRSLVCIYLIIGSSSSGSSNSSSSFYLFIYLFICLFIYLFIYLFICLFLPCKLTNAIILNI